MPLLYYWRPDNFKKDLDFGASYHLNQANPLMHTIEIGDSLWAFTRRKNGSYVLAAHLIIKAKTINPPKFRYGRYRVWGDLTQSRYFDVEKQPNIEKIIRSLSCSTNASILAQSFQGFSAVKKITSNDHMVLTEFAKNFPLESRANLLPEDIIEAQLIYGDSKKIEQFMRDEPPCLGKERLEYLYKSAPTRNRTFVTELQALYKGKCQLCQWAPKDKYGYYICQGHHLQWICRGGEDSLDNMVLLCPNHHLVVHRCDAPFDFEDYSFCFSRHREALLLNSHIK
jgi:5-methylcytosine-specific restriction protein A